MYDKKNTIYCVLFLFCNLSSLSYIYFDKSLCSIYPTYIHVKLQIKSRLPLSRFSGFFLKNEQLLNYYCSKKKFLHHSIPLPVKPKEHTFFVFCHIYPAQTAIFTEYVRRCAYMKRVFVLVKVNLRTRELLVYSLHTAQELLLQYFPSVRVFFGISQAFAIAVNEKIQSFQFKLPPIFG